MDIKDLFEKKLFDKTPLVFVLIILIIIVAVGVYIISSNDSSKKLTITVLDPASDILDAGDYTKKTVFSRGDNIYIYEEFSNFIVVDDNTRCDLDLKVYVYYNDVEYFSDSYQLTLYQYPFESKVVDAFQWPISYNDSWPDGTYEVVASIKDNYSDQSDSAKTSFTLK